MYKLMASNGKTDYGINEYVVDTPEDLVNLPRHCEMGSTVIVISTAEIYMKNSVGEWVKL